MRNEAFPELLPQIAKSTNYTESTAYFYVTFFFKAYLILKILSYFFNQYLPYIIKCWNISSLTRFFRGFQCEIVVYDSHCDFIIIINNT